MIKSPVDKLDFWHDRIETAKKNGRLHQSVYLCSDTLWKNILEVHKKILFDEIKPTDKVLDAGCGYGRMAVYWDNYVGVDFSYDFIAEAKKINPDKTFITADLKDLHMFKDKEFDVGFCISIKAMIQSNLGMEEWDKMQKELQRVCKKLLILEYGNVDDVHYLKYANEYETIT